MHDCLTVKVYVFQLIIVGLSISYLCIYNLYDAPFVGDPLAGINAVFILKYSPFFLSERYILNSALSRSLAVPHCIETERSPGTAINSVMVTRTGGTVVVVVVVPVNSTIPFQTPDHRHRKSCDHQ